MPSVAVLIIGIDGWEKYTAPLLRQVQAYEPTATIVVIDNASAERYPIAPWIHRTERLCYAAAINEARRIAGDTDLDNRPVRMTCVAKGHSSTIFSGMRTRSSAPS